MRKNVYKIIITLLVFINSPVYAEKCYEPSPDLLADENTYFDLLMKKKLTRDQNNTLKVLGKSLKGKWKGRVVSVSCTGTERNPKTKETRSTVKAKFSKGMESSMVLNAELYTKAKKTTANTNMHLFKQDNMFNALIKKNNTEYGERMRRKTARGSQFLETRYSIETGNNSLVMNVNYYISGVLIAYEKWQLNQAKRKK